MKKPATILVDIDNVIADQVGGFYRILTDEYPHISLPPRGTLTEFDIELNFPEEHHELIRSLRLREGFFRSLPMMEGAREGLARLSETVENVRIVTAPTWQWKHCVPEKYAWVEEHLGRDWCGKIIITRDKTLIHGDVLIDDAPAVSGVYMPAWTHVLYDQPYNRNVDLPRSTWDTMHTFLDEWMKNGRV